VRLAVFHSLPPGGARRTMYEIIRRLDHDIDAFSLDLGSAERWPDLVDQYDLAPHVARSESVRIRTPGLHPVVERVWAAEASVRAQRNLAKLIDRGNYDLAIVQHERFMSSPALLAHLQTPTVYVCHEPRRRSFEYLAAPTHPKGLSGVASRLYEQSVRRRDLEWARSADVIVANSSFSAESILRAYGRESVVSHLGVDTTTFELSAGVRRGVLAVGSLDRLKGHVEVIRALGQLPEDGRPSLTIAFERTHAPYEAEMRALASTTGVELVLRRSLSEAELVAEFQQAEVTACAAYLEPFGLTALESMSCGTPVVAVSEGGFRESVTEGGGVCVPRSVEALSAALGDLTDGSRAFDPVEVRRSVVDFWNWDAAADRFDRILTDVIGR